MKPKQPKPKAQKMWATVSERGTILRVFRDKAFANLLADYEHKIIRVTVTPEPKKARKK